MTTPPPPPPPFRPNEVTEKPHPVAWLVPLAGLLALVGVFTPWFKPEATVTGGGRTQTVDAVEDALYSWKEGKLGLIAPIVLVVLSIAVIGLLTGRSVSRFERGSAGPVVNAARGALIAGAVAAASVLASYFLLPSFYKFTENGTDYSWDEATNLLKRQTGVESVELGQGPQLGFWLTAAAAVVAIVGGVLMLVLRTKPEPGAVGGGFGQPPAPYGSQPPPPPGYGTPPAAGYGAQPPSGYGAQQQSPPSGYGTPPAAGYGAQPPSGYQQPPGNPPQG